MLDSIDYRKGQYVWGPLSHNLADAKCFALQIFLRLTPVHIYMLSWPRYDYYFLTLQYTHRFFTASNRPTSLSTVTARSRVGHELHYVLFKVRTTLAI
jgi:hypothetical protein